MSLIISGNNKIACRQHLITLPEASARHKHYVISGSSSETKTGDQDCRGERTSVGEEVVKGKSQVAALGAEGIERRSWVVL